MPDDQREPRAQELEDLARRYVDLWQDQMSALAADPDFAVSLQKVMAAMGVAASGLPAMLSAWPTAVAGMMAATRPEGYGPAGPVATGESRGESAGGTPKRRAKPGGASSSTPGAAAAAAAPDGGGTDLGVLQERLAVLEQRVRELEGRSGRARRGAKPKPRGG